RRYRPPQSEHSRLLWPSPHCPAPQTPAPRVCCRSASRQAHVPDLRCQLPRLSCAKPLHQRGTRRLKNDANRSMKYRPVTIGKEIGRGTKKEHGSSLIVTNQECCLENATRAQKVISAD